MRKRSALKQLQRSAYLTSRAAGDLSAARRGHLIKRVARRSLTRNLFRLFR